MSTVNPLNPPAAVRPVDETKQRIITEARAVVSKSLECQFELGKLAHEWSHEGGTDAEFGAQVVRSREQIQQKRNVWITFGDVWHTYATLSWSHFYVAIDWDDAEEWLAEAVANNWPVGGMKQERAEAYAQLEADDDADEAENDTLEAAIAKPSSKAKPKRSRPQEQPELSSEQLQTALLAKADSIVRYTIPKLVQTAKAIDKFLTERESPGVDIASLTYQQKVDIAGMLRHQEELTLIFNDARAAVSPPKKEVLQ